MIFPAISIAQRVNDIIIDPKTNGKDFNLLLKDIESKNDVNFIYNEEDMQGISAYLIQNKTRLLNYIEDYLIEFNVVSLNDKTVVLMKKILFLILEKNQIIIGLLRVSRVRWLL